MRSAACIAAVFSAVLSAGPAVALQLNPLDFASLGALGTTADIVINSDTLQLSGGASFTGVLDQATNAAVFAFDDIQTGTLSLTGSNPLALLSRGNAVFNGPVTSSITGDVEIAATGTVTLNNFTSSASGSTLTILASNDLQIPSGGRIVSPGPVTIGSQVLTVNSGPVVPSGRAGVGSISIRSASSGLFHSFDAFNVPSGQIQLTSQSGNVNLGASAVVTARISADSGAVVIEGTVAPVPLPASLFLFGSGLGGFVLCRLKRPLV